MSRHTSIFLQAFEAAVSHVREGLGATNIIAREPSIMHRLSPGAVQVTVKIQGYLNLRPNWDSYGALPPTPATVAQANRFIRELDKRRIAVYFTAPGPNGEILLELKNDQKAAEIYFYPDQPAGFTLFDQDEAQLEATLSEGKAKLFSFME